MRTVPARIYRADGSVEDVFAVEYEEIAAHPVLLIRGRRLVTELVDPTTLANGDSITFTYEDI